MHSIVSLGQTNKPANGSSYLAFSVPADVHLRHPFPLATRGTRGSRLYWMWSKMAGTLCSVGRTAFVSNGPLF